MPLIRALIKTHHMTSRAKIAAIAKSARRTRCAVLLKTGSRPPGVVVVEAEGQGREGEGGKGGKGVR